MSTGSESTSSLGSAAVSIVGQGGQPEPALLQALRTLAVDRVTVEVIPALAAAGIPSILLKGPSIARWLYPSGGRPYGDTDLLVPADQFRRAGEVLGGIGFSEALEGWNQVELGLHPVESPFVRRSSGRGMAGGIVDLHHNLPELPTADRLLWEVLSANSETMALGATEVRVLVRPALALHIVLHALQHGFGWHTGEDLRRAVDELPFDGWTMTAGLAAQLGVGDLLAAGLRSHSSGAALADCLGLPTAARINPYRFNGTPRGAQSLNILREAGSVRTMVRVVRWKVLPSRTKIRYVFGRRYATGPALAWGYARWWWGLARASVPAAWFMARDRRDVRGAHGARTRG